MKPVLFLTGNVPAYRAGALAALHAAEGIEVATFGGRSLHGGPQSEGARGYPSRVIRPASAFALAASDAHRAVILSTAGRLALLGGWAGARRAGVPLILWASLWAHPRTLAHAAGYLPLRRLYASADALVTYGPHVSAYVRARGAQNIHVAPQSVDNGFWGAAEVRAAELPAPADAARVRFLFVGRDAPEKGLGVLAEAWSRASLPDDEAALILAGPGHQADTAGTILGRLEPPELRAVYEACDVLVIPSVASRTFREPWGLVVNEAMNRGLAVIASDAVGAAAGGLVRDGETGLVVGAGDAAALAAAIRRMALEGGLRERLGAAAREAVGAYTHEAWAAGFSAALGTVGLSRDHW